MKRQIKYGNLTGGLNNVSSRDVINSSPNKTETPEMVNIEYYKLGGIQSMEGNIQIGDVQDSAISGGFEYTKGNNRYMVIATHDGDIKIYNPATKEFDFIYKFAHSSDRVSFVNMNNGIVVTNGIDDLLFYEKGRKQQLSGRIEITEGSTNVVGTDTNFTVELHTGDSILVDNNVYFIDEVTDNENLVLRTESLSSASDISYYLSEISECNAYLVNADDENLKTPIRGNAIQYYNGRLWIGSDNGLFYSQVGKYDGWDIKNDAGVLYSIYNDSSEIKALGLYSNYLLIHKEFYTYILTCAGEGTTIEVKPYTSISCDSQQSFIVSNTKYYVYSKNAMGIYPMAQLTVFSDKYVGEEISKNVRNLFPNVRYSDADKIFAVSLPKKRWMVFYLPLSDTLGSGCALIFDFQTKSWLYRKVPQNVTIAFNYNNLIYIGTQDGKILKEFSGNTFNGEPIKAYYKTPWFSWNEGYTQSFAEFNIDLGDDVTNNFYINTYKNGGVKTETRLISSDMVSGEALLWDGVEGQDLLDNDTLWDDDIWVSSELTGVRMVLPNNVFENFQIEFGINSIGQQMSISSFDFRRIEFEEEPW